jgi:hypothetical protein
MATDKQTQKAESLMKQGIVKNSVVSNGQVLIKNQISGNWEPYSGQPVQAPSGNYAGRKPGKD